MITGTPHGTAYSVVVCESQGREGQSSHLHAWGLSIDCRCGLITEEKMSSGGQGDQGTG